VSLRRIRRTSHDSCPYRHREHGERAVATSVAVAPSEQPVVEPPFVATGDQLAAGTRVLESAVRESRGSFLVVTGGRGAGKTTAACELANRYGGSA
jgi:Cdc6-like AAA superfamily ATPase